MSRSTSHDLAKKLLSLPDYLIVDQDGHILDMAEIIDVYMESPTHTWVDIAAGNMVRPSRKGSKMKAILVK